MAARTARNDVLRGLRNHWLIGVSAGALAALSLAKPVQGQTAAAPAAAQSAVAFDIPAQPLDAALAAYGRATGVQIIYDSALTGSLRSAAVRGSFTPQAALSRLLGPTGLTPRFTGPRTATLRGGSQAQTLGQAPGGTINLDTITIFGEKIQKQSSETTTSVGVVTGERIQQEQIQDIHEAINGAANAISTRASGNNSGITIRGINSEGLSQNQSANSAPVIVDGAVQNTETVRRGIRSVWDVEQVEVLRGPQSTLQGRNATAGAVFIKTKDPTYAWEAVGEQTVGTHNLSSTGLVLSGPLIANELAFRVAGQLYRSDMDIKYADGRNDVMGRDRFGNIRGKVLWEPKGIPGLRALFTVAHTDDRPGVNSVTGPNYFDRVFATSSATLDYRKTKTNNYIADVSYAVAPSATVRSVTSYAGTLTDVNSAPGNTTFIRGDTRDGSDFTQDLRLEIENRGNGLSGVLGLYYGEFKNETNSRIQTDVPILGFSTLQDFNAQNTTTSMAAYADLKFRIDRLAFIGGGRALHDEVGSTIIGTVLDPALFPGPSFDRRLDTTTSEEFARFLPKAGATYDVAPNQTVGFMYSQGYRQGFADLYPFAGGPYFGVYRVAPEKLNAYELSYRSFWLDSALTLNANFFYYDYRNQQVAFDPPAANIFGAVPPGYAVITNAAKSHSYGAEFEARYRFSESFTAYASVGLLRTHFDDIFVPTVGSFSGNKFPEAPGYTVNVGGLYQDPLGWFVGANARFVDGFYSYGDLANTPGRFVEDAVIADARAGWEFKNVNGVPYPTSTKLTFFAKNLFNEKYLTYISNPSAGVRTAGVGDSRQVGVTLTVRY